MNWIYTISSPLLSFPEYGLTSRRILTAHNCFLSSATLQTRAKCYFNPSELRIQLFQRFVSHFMIPCSQLNKTSFFIKVFLPVLARSLQVNIYTSKSPSLVHFQLFSPVLLVSCQQPALQMFLRYSWNTFTILIATLSSLLTNHSPLTFFCSSLAIVFTQSGTKKVSLLSV